MKLIFITIIIIIIVVVVIIILQIENYHSYWKFSFIKCNTP